MGIFCAPSVFALNTNDREPPEPGITGLAGLYWVLTRVTLVSNNSSTLQECPVDGFSVSSTSSEFPMWMSTWKSAVAGWVPLRSKTVVKVCRATSEGKRADKIIIIFIIITCGELAYI